MVLNATTFILLSIADTLHQNALDSVKYVFSIKSIFILNLNVHRVKQKVP